jgi:protein SCO1/2
MTARASIVLVTVLAACSGRTPSERVATPTLPASAPPSTSEPSSIYDLAMQVRDAGERTVGLDVDRGHRVLVSMFFGSCPAACPALIDELARIVDDAHDPDLRVLLVSFDAARDTPERLRELARAHHLDDRWTLAAAGDADARALAAVLGVRYRKLPDGGFSHTLVAVALDRDGRPFGRIDGLGNHDALVGALVSAARTPGSRRTPPPP